MIKNGSKLTMYDLITLHDMICFVCWQREPWSNKMKYVHGTFLLDHNTVKVHVAIWDQNKAKFFINVFIVTEFDFMLNFRRNTDLFCFGLPLLWRARVSSSAAWRNCRLNLTPNPKTRRILTFYSEINVYWIQLNVYRKCWSL